MELNKILINSLKCKDTSEEFKKLDNDIYCSTINKMDINLLNKEIVFDLSLIDDTVTNHVPDSLQGFPKAFMNSEQPTANRF